MDPMTCILLEGSSGTGKTLLSSEAVKIKISQFDSQDKPVRVIVTKHVKSDEGNPLLNNFREHYFSNIDVTIQPIEKLAKDQSLDLDFKHPKAEMTQIMNSLSSSDQLTILLVDELVACDRDGQVSADWSDLPTAPNVVWILCVRPQGGAEMRNFRPPSGPGILSTKLVHGHRNCYQIRSVGILPFYISYKLHYRRLSTFILSHIPLWKKATIKMEDDVPLEAEELPGGFTPLWLDVPQDTTHLEILTRLSQLEEIGNKSVTVLYWSGERDRAAADYCEEMNWSYRDSRQMYGCEDEVIIAIDALVPESISRPHNLLVVVTTVGHK